MPRSDPDRRPITAVLTGQQWGALDRWREAHGYPTIAAAVRHIVTQATDDYDHLLHHASHMGDPRLLTSNVSSHDDTSPHPNVSPPNDTEGVTPQ